MKKRVLLILILVAFIMGCTQQTDQTDNTFLVLTGGYVTNNNGQYSLEEDFLPHITDDKNYSKWIDKGKKDTIYRIETVDTDGKKETYYTTMVYTLPGNDYGESLEKDEPPKDIDGFFDSTFILITPRTRMINFYIGDKMIKSLTRKGSAPKITALKKTADTKGYNLNWDIKKEANTKVWISLERLESPGEWRSLAFGNSEEYKEYFFNPEYIFTMYDNVSIRLVITDGFYIDTITKKNFITMPKEKKIEMLLEGLPDKGYMGQEVYIELMFVDPETGTGCGGKGCTFGENKGKYEVTWFSDKQEIPASDIYEGLRYVFKKEGTHTLGARVQHKEKPELKGEISQKVEVSK